jgi:hypothetical protein
VATCRGDEGDEFTAVRITPVSQQPFEHVTSKGDQARQAQHVHEFTEPCLSTSDEPAIQKLGRLIRSSPISRRSSTWSTPTACRPA